MELSQIGLAYLSLISFLTGIILGAVYDIVSPLCAICGKVYSARLREKLEATRLPFGVSAYGSKKGRVNRAFQFLSVFVHDIVYMIAVGVTLSLLFYRFNDGVIRISAVMLIALGMLLYRVALRKITLAFAECVFFLLRCAVRYALYFVCIPIKATARGLSQIYFRIACVFVKKHAKRYSKKQKTYIRGAVLSSGMLGELALLIKDDKHKSTLKIKRGRSNGCNKEKKSGDRCHCDDAGDRGDNNRGKSDDIQSAQKGICSARFGA